MTCQFIDLLPDLPLLCTSSSVLASTKTGTNLKDLTGGVCDQHSTVKKSPLCREPVKCFSISIRVIQNQQTAVHSILENFVLQLKNLEEDLGGG